MGGLLVSQVLTLYTTPGRSTCWPSNALSPRRAPARDTESMNISAPFIRRPIATSLLTLALLLAGALAFVFLPVAPLPQVEFPTISSTRALPGASPETMASAVATPLERQFGRIAGVTEMTSVEPARSHGIVLQFDLDREHRRCGA